MFGSIWYDSLTKPMFTPPKEIFTPAWIFLYSLILAALLIFVLKKNTTQDKKNGYEYFFVQIILNFLWSPTFFVMKNIKFALVVILMLDIFTLLTVKEFYKVSKTSAILLIPYIIWLLFATYLNIGYVILN